MRSKDTSLKEHQNAWQARRCVPTQRVHHRFFNLRLASRIFTATFLTCLTALPGFTADGLGNMDFKLVTTGGNCLSCAFIRADGKIADDTPEKFAQFFEETGKSDLNGFNVHINSQGGSLLAAVRLGLLFRGLGVSTVVSRSRIREKYETSNWHLLDAESDEEGLCASACAFAFAGGVERYATLEVRPDQVGYQSIGKIGVHQFYKPVAFNDLDVELFTARDAMKDQFVVSYLLGYLREMGVSADVLQLATGTNPSDMHWLSSDELRATNLDNASFASTAIEAYKNGVAIIEFSYRRMGALIKNEIWCRGGKLQMLSTLKWKGGATLKPDDQWNLYGNMTLGSGGPLFRLVESNSYLDGDAEIVQMTFSVEGASVEQLVGVRNFNFWDNSSRYASRAAGQLSFSLPSHFNGMYILPRTCQ